MRLSRLKTIGSFVVAAMLSAPLWAANTALPGTLNYVEGQAAVANDRLDAKSIGSVTLQPGQTLSTDAGKAEVLLTPGVFLRVGDNSAVTMVSPSLTNTEVTLRKGTALVEVGEIQKANLLRVRQGDTTTQLLKTGLYEFDANQNAVRVFKGEAMVDDAGQNVKVKSGHELDLDTNAQLKTRKFDKDSLAQSDLYRFSSLRSGYLAQANADAARVYVTSGWYGPGWYWDPMFTSYTWIPGSGLLYSPFGWGFYSPGWAWRAPLYRGYYHGGYYGYANSAVVGGRVARPGGAMQTAPSHAMVSPSRGFGSASPMHSGGGFHGGVAHR